MQGFKKGFKPKAQRLADGGMVENIARDTGEYWSRDNAEFDATNPSTLQRIGRQLNPATGFGSAVGAMYDAASTGDVKNMALSAASAIPAFAVARPAAAAVKAASPHMGRTAANLGVNTTVGAVIDKNMPSGMAVGFKPKSAQGLKDGGMVRGPGTGTSDSIAKKVPVGSFIMPSDSVEQIGEKNLGAMGFKPNQKMPVRVSNGEYELPPEQVHAIGVQALNKMKDVTHTPAEMQGAGFKAQHFFADGGEVDPTKRRPISPTNTFPGGHPDFKKTDDMKQIADVASNAAKGFVPRQRAEGSGWRTDSVLAGTGQDVSDEFNRGEYGRAAGTAIRGTLAAIPAAFADAGDDINRIAAPVVNAGLGFGKGLLGISDAAATPAPQASAAAKPAQVAQPAANPKVDTVAKPLQQASAQPQVDIAVAAQPPAGSQLDNQNALNGVVGRTVQGAPGIAKLQGGMFKNPMYTDDPVRAANEFNKEQIVPTVAGFRAGGASTGAPTGNGIGVPGGFSAGGGSTSAALAAARAAAAERGDFDSVRRSYQTGGSTFNGETELDTDISNVRQSLMGATGQRRTGLLQQLSALQEQQAALARNGIATADLGIRTRTAEQDSKLKGSQIEAQGFQLRSSKRLEKLYSQYEAAKAPQERADIARQIRELQGKTDPDEWQSVALQGGTDAAGNRTEGVLAAVNKRTGEMKRFDAGQQARTPQAGEVRGGYRFKGGNPADQKNWERV